MFQKTAALILFCFCFTTNAEASVVITINATVNNDPIVGLYTQGQSVSYSFYLNPSFDPSNSSSSYSSGNGLFWGTDTTSHSSLWSDVTGTSLTGTWQLPSSTPNDPNDYLESQFGVPGEIYLGTFADDPTSSVGLQANGFDVVAIAFSGAFVGLDFTDPGFLENPSDYLKDYAGTYAIDTLGLDYLNASDGQSTYQIFFDATSIEISSHPDMDAVPEPASVIVWSALAALVLMRRRFA